MLYMVIERFREGAASEIYRRASERGRMLPDELTYIDSWVDLEFGTCYQLMKCDDPSVFTRWTAAWDDLVDFEIIPVNTSAEAARIMASSSGTHEP